MATMKAPPLAKDLSREEKQAILLSVTCPKCGAEPDRWCFSPAGKSADVCHSARYARVSADGRIRW